MASKAIVFNSTDWVGWTASPSLPYGRGTSDILLSCLFTLLICTWTVQHPYIPASDEKRYWVSFRKFRVMAITIIAPEMLMGAAIGEYLLAKKSVKAANDLLNQGWTQTHGFFALMGGFQAKVVNENGSSALLPINSYGILALKRCGAQMYPFTKGDINDKSKADFLVKATAVLQSLWLVIQCLARAAQGLPITPLELATTGFVGCTVTTYLVWFSKPQGAEVPITVLSISTHASPKQTIDDGWASEIQISGLWKKSVQNALEDKRRMRTLHYFAGQHNHSMRFSMLAGMLFGSIHIIGWNFNFPTRIEAILWRTAAVTATAMPAASFISLMISYFGFSCIGKFFAFIGAGSGGPDEERGIGWPEWVILAFYGLMRMYLLVALFITFRSQPPNVYEAVHWSKYFPHWA